MGNSGGSLVGSSVPTTEPLRPRTRPAPPSEPIEPDSDLLSARDLARLNRRRNAPAVRQLLLHLSVLLLGGLLWGLPLAGLTPGGVAIPWPLRLLGLLLLGLGLAFGFCAMHECGHRTAFASREMNDAVAWWAGVLSFYNADYYRRYHQWHHRYTHLIGLDPELEDPPPTTRRSYLLELSGLPWWIGKLRGHWQGLLGRFEARPYLPAEAHPAVQRSIRRQFAVYGLLLLLSLPAANGALLWLWLLPLAIGQPLLRFVLLAEHGGCPFIADGRCNTRTTLTTWPLRLLMWQMPFHAEHHLYPSLPFHSLAEAHSLVQGHLAQLDRGYLSVHRGFWARPSQLAYPTASADSSATSIPAV